MLGQIARETGARFGDRPVVVTPSDTLTYAALDRCAELVAVGLIARGIHGGSVVASLLPSCAEWVVLAVALDRVGAVMAPVSPKLAAPERAELVALVEPDLVVTDAAGVDGLPLRTPVVVLQPGDRGEPLWVDGPLDAPGGPDASITNTGTNAITNTGVSAGAGTAVSAGASTSVSAGAGTAVSAGAGTSVSAGAGTAVSAGAGTAVSAGASTGDDRITTICFTSGTTGRAKGAVFTVAHQRAVQALDLGPGAEGRWDGGSAMLASTQFAHVGMALKLPWYLRTGSTLHVLDPWRAEHALALVAEQRMPTIGVVAPQLALMLRSESMDSLDLGAVTAIIAGGAASPPGLVSEARERFGAAYSVRYSSTESGGVGLGTAFDAPDDEALHTIGRPRDGVEARVADEADRELPDGEPGELQIRSPAVMAGYWRDPEASARALTDDDWLRTGDLAVRRHDGCFVLAGRRTDMYIRGGYNVFPEEVEAALSDHPAVAALAISPRPDDVLGEVGVAVVVPRDPAAPPTLDELRDHGRERVARHKLPEGIVMVDELPLTTVAKLDRTALAALARDAGGRLATDVGGRLATDAGGALARDAGSRHATDAGGVE